MKMRTWPRGPSRAGASGFLLKHSAGEELVNAIHQALQGRVYLTPALTKDVMERLAAPAGRSEPALTARQLEVLRLVLDGRRMKEIGAALQLSTRTVETHKYEMMRLLGVSSTAELVTYAIEHRLIVRDRRRDRSDARPRRHLPERRRLSVVFRAVARSLPRQRHRLSLSRRAAARP